MADLRSQFRVLGTYVRGLRDNGQLGIVWVHGGSRHNDCRQFQEQQEKGLVNRAKHPRQARLRHARAPDPWAVQGGPASLRGRRGLFRVLARGSFLFGGEFSKTPTMISALSLPNFYLSLPKCPRSNFYLSLPKCPRFIQFSRFSYTKPQVMGLLESLDSFDIKCRYVRSINKLTSIRKF